ncbi:MAG: Fe-S protein assembly co-chaperone HscB [Nitrospiraceae bacterium]
MDRVQKLSGTRVELQMARSMCWHCQSEVAGEYFCDRCVKVQPLSKELDYFTCLGLPRRLRIDPENLEKRFYELSRTFHPDFFQTKTEGEQTISLGNSALLNIAYRTLKDPIQRAEYLLRLEAGSAKDIRNSPPADLFEEILALQDNLEEFRAASSASGSSPETLEPLRNKLAADRDTLEQRQHDMERRLFELFEAWDTLQDQGEAPNADSRKKRELFLKDMREILSNRTYVRNILDDLVVTIG